MTTRIKHIKKSVLDSIVNGIAKDYSIEPEVILGRSRRKPYPKARRKVAKALWDLGFNYKLIAEALDKDYTAILYMLDEKYRKRNNARANLHHERKRNDQRQ